jgi:hypothetical protein
LMQVLLSDIVFNHFQIFPGIFSSIDAYTKKMIRSWWDGHQYFPAYLNSLGRITGYKKIPGFSKFRIWDKDSNIWLTGIPDEILIREDMSHIILDYKTANTHKIRLETTMIPPLLMRLSLTRVIKVTF